MKALMKYPGAKWALAEWITSFFPPHHSYLEPFFGSGGVLLNKGKSNIETINDLDDEVINLFECIRNNPERLAKAIFLTPYSRQAYEEAYITKSTDNIEKARNFYIRCNMGHGYRTTGEKVGWKVDIQGREKSYAVRHWNDVPERIIEAAERMKCVQIESRPANSVIERFNFENVLIYADPPYLLKTRHGKQYKHEMTESDHIEFLEVIKNHKGPAIVSGYESKLYNSALKDWHKEFKQSRTQSLAIKTEVLWMNFEPSIQMEIKLKEG